MQTNESNTERINSLLKYLDLLNDLNKNGVKVYEEIKRTIQAIETVLLIK
jgi:hypothetical protein